MKIPKDLDLKNIDVPDLSEIAEQLGDAKLNDPSSVSGDGQEQLIAMQKAFVSVANQFWRLTTAVIDKDQGEIKEDLNEQDLKRVGRAMDSMKETFESLGIKIIDKTGDTFDAGFPDQVVTEEPRKGISKEQVIRTIRPTILWQQKMVQRGEIDIAVPEK